MKTRATYAAIAGVLLLGASHFFQGCVDVQENLPASNASGVNVHPQGWMEAGTDAFHGSAVKAAGWDMGSCQTCHGKQYSGGTSQQTCLTCHNRPGGPENCRTCHGSSTTNAAPPQDTDNNTATTDRGVGAHQAHVVATSGKTLSCGTCHDVPNALSAPGHIDSTLHAEVMMDDSLANLPTDGGAIVPNATYNATTLGCSTVYCHGTFKNGNTANAPVWTAAATGACGTCHGDVNKATTKDKALPKTIASGGTHPPDTQCQWCHSNINASAVFTNASAHVDGTINLVDLTNDCTRCHGTGTNPAPPSDLEGNTAVTNRGVGAHAVHLAGTGLGLQVACVECHTVPGTTYASGHLDTDRPAEVLFNGSLASHQTSGVDPNPSYSTSGISCSSTYCHGSFTNGNLTNTPTWNAPSGTGAVCGTCHGDVNAATAGQKALPKTAANGGTHPAWTDCQWCHSNVNATPSITDAATHVNGTVNLVSFNLPADCSRCHGSATNAAPPNDLEGSTTSAAVGAHQAHLATTFGKTVQCAECHSVPTGVYDAGHLDTAGPAEVPVDGALASHATSGVTPSPSYSSANLNCSSTYCHGSFTNGNTTNAPAWNATPGSGAACGTCHGSTSGGTLAEKALPKTATNGGTHPPYSRCETCHTSVTSALAFTNKELHVDGQVALFQLTSQADCARCHGSATNAAPPNDLSGGTSSAAVGAHQKHLVATTARSVVCNTCHEVPASLVYTGADGHIDASLGAEITFVDSLAYKTTSSGTIVPNPTFTAASLSCGSTYCHGTFKNGNASNAPVWNVASSGACGTCHGNPTTGNPVPGGNHPANNNCNFCHTVSGETAVATFDGVATWTITNAPRHVNGKLNLFAAENDNF